MTRTTATAATSALTQPILSPRRARTEFEQRAPSPFLVDRPETTRAVEARGEPESGATAEGVRLVLRGAARRPVLTAAIAAMIGMTAIGLFLGLMLGDLAG